MKLSKKDKMELRKSVEVLLNASPDNKKYNYQMKH